jgi:hypothetical protein
MSEKTYHAIRVECTVNRMLATPPTTRKTDSYTEHEMKDKLKKAIK